MSTHTRWSTLLSALRSSKSSPDGAALLPLALELGTDVGDATIACSLTEFDGTSYRTPIASAEVALVLDEAQYAAQIGPCVLAARERQVQRVDDLAADVRFPAFAAAAIGFGVHSSLSVPVTGLAHRTALNLYATEPAAYVSTRAGERAALLAHCVAAASMQDGEPTDGALDDESDDAAFQHAQWQSELVNRALSSVMAADKVSRDEAFELLTLRSRRDGNGIAEVSRRALMEASE